MEPYLVDLQTHGLLVITLWPSRVFYLQLGTSGLTFLVWADCFPALRNSVISFRKAECAEWQYLNGKAMLIMPQTGSVLTMFARAGVQQDALCAKQVGLTVCNTTRHWTLIMGGLSHWPALCPLLLPSFLSSFFLFLKHKLLNGA